MQLLLRKLPNKSSKKERQWRSFFATMQPVARNIHNRRTVRLFFAKVACYAPFSPDLEAIGCLAWILLYNVAVLKLFV
ncbi:MAG: hypothetical protein HFG20_08260 [Anaerotruncus sp.]|nr:hypothetical protein [Anaerotruncus sp.]